MSSLIKDDEVWHKYDKIWDVIKDKINNKFHCEPVYQYKYLKTKVKEYNGEIKTNFLNNGMSKENMHYSCIACITIDHPEVYLEEYKYRTKKTKIPNFIKNELKWDSESGSDSDDKKLMAKINDYDYDSDSEVQSKSNAKRTSFWINVNKNVKM